MDEILTNPSLWTSAVGVLCVTVTLCVLWVRSETGKFHDKEVIWLAREKDLLLRIEEGERKHYEDLLSVNERHAKRVEEFLQEKAVALNTVLESNREITRYQTVLEKVFTLILEEPK